MGHVKLFSQSQISCANIKSFILRNAVPYVELTCVETKFLVKNVNFTTFKFSAELGYGASFWTSASNLHCKSGYKWCMANMDLYKGIAWGGGQPDNGGNVEWCAEIQMSPGADAASVLNDIDCNTGRRVICEVSSNARFTVRSQSVPLQIGADRRRN
jgi:hypothetical protein